MEELGMIEISGKSVDEAVFLGITQMGLALDEVSIEIVEEISGFLGMGKKVKVRLVKKSAETLEKEYSKPDERPSQTVTEQRHSQSYDRVRSDKRDFRTDRNEYAQNRYAQEEPFVSNMVETQGEKEDTIKGFLTELIRLMGITATVHCQKNDEGIMKVELRGDSKQIGALIGYRGDVLDSIQHITSLAVNKDEESYNRIVLDVEGYRQKREQTLVVLAKRMAQKAQKKGKVVMEPMNPYERRILHATLQDYDSVTTYSEGEDPMRRVIIVSKDYVK